MKTKKYILCRAFWSYWWGFTNSLNISANFSNLHEYVDKKCKEIK